MSTPSSTRSSRGTETPHPPRSQQGTGVISSLIGVVVFLMFVLFGVQVLYGLYATSVVSAVTFDAAQEVAGSDFGRDGAAQQRAETSARSKLGPYARDVAFRWNVDEERVHLTVRGRRPSFLPRSLAGSVGLGEIVRTVSVRTERLR